MVTIRHWLSLQSLQLCGVALVLLAAPESQADEFADLLVTSGYEHNLPRAYRGEDRQGSEFLAAGLRVGKLYQPQPNTSLILTGGLTLHSFFDQHGFDYSRFSVDISLQQKAGIGPFTPRVGFTVGADREDGRGAERDRDSYSFELSLSKRINAVLGFTSGYTVEISRGLKEPAVDFSELPYRPGAKKPTDPMDYTNRSLFGAVDYTLRNGWLLSTRYRYLDGHVISSAVPPVFDLFRFTEAVARDPAYDRLRLMYLMDTTADMWSTSVSIPLDNDTAMDIGYHWQAFDVDYIGGYDNRQFMLSVIHQF